MPQSMPQSQRVIYGTVIDEHNQPAREVGIAVAGSGASPRRLPGVITDQNGHYRIGSLLDWGKYTVYAEDWTAGYSTLVNSEPHEVTVSPEHPEAELNFRLPPKAGFLDFHLSNRVTGGEIRDLVVNVRAAGKASEKVHGISQSTATPVLVPSDEDLLIHVTSHGFQEWNRSVGKGLPIRVKSGDHLKLDVRLEPATEGAAVREIKLTEPRDIADAASISTAIGILVNDAAASCPAATSQDRQACACSFKEDLKKLKSAYLDAVAKHPGWKEADSVVAYANAKGTSATLSFPGIERQLSACDQRQK